MTIFRLSLSHRHLHSLSTPTGFQKQLQLIFRHIFCKTLQSREMRRSHRAFSHLLKNLIKNKHYSHLLHSLTIIKLNFYSKCSATLGAWILTRSFVLYNIAPFSKFKLVCHQLLSDVETLQAIKSLISP